MSFGASARQDSFVEQNGVRIRAPVSGKYLTDARQGNCRQPAGRRNGSDNDYRLASPNRPLRSPTYRTTSAKFIAWSLFLQCPSSNRLERGCRTVRDPLDAPSLTPGQRSKVSLTPLTTES